MNQDDLLQKAKGAMKYAYVPYSNFPVGAAILTTSGHVFTGSNIENAAYPLACCAERIAIFKALSEGYTEFSALTVTADTQRPVPPCGSCRQVLSEFLTPDTKVHLANADSDMTTLTMADLLPYSFQPNDLPHDH